MPAPKPIARVPSFPTDSLAFAFWAASQMVVSVLSGQSLAEGQIAVVPVLARAGVQDLVYGTLRAYGRGDFWLSCLLEKPVSAPEIRALLLLALYRLETRDDVHTVVDQAVTAASAWAGGRFKALVNGVLRNFLRRRDALRAALIEDPVAVNAHPAWWLNRLQKAYPTDWPLIVAAGNTPPPMTLRINRRQISRQAYAARLADEGIAGLPVGEDGFLLQQPLPVERLPGFANGWVSVQDWGAQRAADILSPAPQSRVLDACAAPGGKTAHLLEGADLDLWALDLKPARCRQMEDNLRRLKLKATVCVADCVAWSRGWDGPLFDAILADVPCSASGVVRRHPDAKWLRREEDIMRFAQTQATILDALWQVLRPGGKLLYATCSVFPEENTQQIERFLARQPQGECRYQEQLLPSPERDGFFYCLLEKSA